MFIDKLIKIQEEITDIEKRYKTASEFLEDLNNYIIKEQEQLDQAYWEEQEFI